MWNSYSQVNSVVCQFEAADSSITFSFDVAQTKDMLNKELMVDAKNKIQESVESDTFVLRLASIYI